MEMWMEPFLATLLAALGLFVTAVFTDVPSIYIQDITVPDELERNGYKPSVVVDQLFHAMRQIAEGGGSREYAGNWQSDFEDSALDAMADAVHVRDLVRAAQASAGFLGLAVRGSITRQGDSLRFAVRVVRPDRSARHGVREAMVQEDGRLDDMDDLIARMAMDLIREGEPYILATYMLRNRSRTGDLAAVEEFLSTRIARSAADSRYWFRNLLGTVRFMRGDMDGAAAAFGQASHEAPSNGLIQSNLAMVEALRGNTALAESLFAKATAAEIKPVNRAVALSEWGQLLASQGRVDEAAVCFRRAVQSHAGYGDVYVHWGAMLKAQGDSDGAEAMFTKARDLYSQLSIVTENLMFAVLERSGGVERRIAGS
jgi:Flp pilus assembly protein TadD